MNKEALEARKQGLLVTIREKEDELWAYRGAVSEIDYWLSQLPQEENADLPQRS